MLDEIQKNAQAIQGCGCALMLMPISALGFYVLYLLLFSK